MSKYSEQIADIMLAEDPQQEIALEWGAAKGIFAMAGEPITTRPRTGPTGKSIGCLTMIRQFPEIYEAQTASLTAGILADRRLPNAPEDITVDMLPAFLEWRERIDEELGL